MVTDSGGQNEHLVAICIDAVENVIQDDRGTRQGDESVFHQHQKLHNNLRQNIGQGDVHAGVALDSGKSDGIWYANENEKTYTIRFSFNFYYITPFPSNTFSW